MIDARDRFAVGVERWIVIAAGVLAVPLSWLIKRLMHLDSLRDDNVGDELRGQKPAGEPAAAGMHPQTNGSPDSI